MAPCTFLAHPQPRDSGDYRHRITLPGTALARHLEVEELQTTHPAHVARAVGAGVLVVCMVADGTVEAIVAERRRRGRPTVYELSDDFRDFPDALPSAGFYRDPVVRDRIGRLAAGADLLQCSSHGLLRRYGPLNPNAVVLPNQLDAVPPLAPRDDAPTREPVLGWAGSLGHLDDAHELAALLAGWRAARGLAPGHGPALRLMAPPAIRDVFEAAGLRADWRPPAGFDAYLAFLDGLDVGFATIGERPFALGRSDGKFLEYASRGVVCLASARGEYLHGIRDRETGLLYADPAGFSAALDALRTDPAGRRRLREAAHAHVSRERTHAAAAHDRAALYAGLLARAGLAARRGDGALHRLEDPGEPTLAAATIAHAQGRLDAALAGYLQVAAAHPAFHLPWARAAMIARALGAHADAARFEATADAALRAELAARPLAPVPA